MGMDPDKIAGANSFLAWHGQLATPSITTCECGKKLLFCSNDLEPAWTYCTGQKDIYQGEGVLCPECGNYTIILEPNSEMVGRRKPIEKELSLSTDEVNNLLLEYKQQHEARTKRLSV